MSNIPANLKYSKSHEWILEEDGVFTIGLTDYAQSALGDIVFINLPEEGDSVTAGESFSDVESVKAVSDVFSPVTGTVTAVNEALLELKDPKYNDKDEFTPIVEQYFGYNASNFSYIPADK